MARPRVTSQFIQTPIASPLAIGSRVLAIIATGSTKFYITEKLTRGSASYDTLIHKPTGATDPDRTTGIVRIGSYISTNSDTSGVPFVASTDYNIDTATPGTYKLTWSTHKPALNETYYVTYYYDKAPAVGSAWNDYTPRLYSNFNDVLNNYGPINYTTSLDVASYATLGAQIAFDIGVKNIIIAQADSSDATGFGTAITRLEQSIGGINPFYVVALTGGIVTGDADTVRGKLIAHCKKMASVEFGKERYPYGGLKDYAGTGLAASTFTAMASAYSDSRVILIGDYTPIRSIKDTDGNTQSVTLDGTFDALAKAAFRCTQAPVSEPMMNKAINGAFTGYSRKWNDTDIDILVDGCVCVSEDIAGIIKVVDDITTNGADEVEIDISTVETRDILIKQIRTSLSDRFKGIRSKTSTTADIVALVDTELDKAIKNDLALAKGKISANRASGSLRRWEVGFTYYPVTKVRDIDVSFSIDLGLIA